MANTSKALRILWVKSGPLYPLDTGGKKRTHSMLVELNRQHEVTYLAFKDVHASMAPEELEAPYADRKVWIKWKEAQRNSFPWVMELIRNLLTSRLPFALEKYASAEMSKAVLQLVTDEHFDLVVCDFLVPALNFERIHDQLQVPTVLFQHNIEAMIWKRLAAGRSNRLAQWLFGRQAERMAVAEQRLSKLFNGVITVSKEDSDTARKEYRLDNVLGDVPAGVDADYFSPPASKQAEGRTIGFLGSMDWMPNIEGVLWFTEEVLCKFRPSRPETRFIVIGRKPPNVIRELGDKDPLIEVTGTVDDVRPYLERCDILVVPLLSGGGTRIKIMEALAAGVPVVSTRVGAEGLGLEEGKHIMIADTPKMFAEAVERLFEDPLLRKKLSHAGRELVREEFGWGRATQAFMDHAEKLQSSGAS